MRTKGLAHIAVLALIGYAVFSGQGKKNTSNQKSESSKLVSANSDGLWGSKAFFQNAQNTFKLLKEIQQQEPSTSATAAPPIIAKATTNLRTMDLSRGDKIFYYDSNSSNNDVAASCGDIAHITYKAFYDNKMTNLFDSTNANGIDILIGGNRFISGLELGLIGMNESATRVVAIPANLAFDNLRFRNDKIRSGVPVFYSINLESLKKPMPTIATSITSIHDNEPPEVVAKLNWRARCGNLVTIRYRFIEVKTNKEIKIDYNNVIAAIGTLPNSSEQNFWLGAATTPVIFNYLITGMSVGTTRSAVIDNSATNQILSQFDKNGGKTLIHSGNVRIEIDLLNAKSY